jgi:hypothetical protein
MLSELDIGYIQLNENDINNVTEVPATGYEYETDQSRPGHFLEPGWCYALKPSANNSQVQKYFLLEIHLDFPQAELFSNHPEHLKKTLVLLRNIYL